MDYPTSITAVSAALDLYAYAASVPLPEGARTALIAAANKGSIVEKCHAAIHAMADYQADLDAEGNALLAGCTKLCLEHGWKDRNGHAYASVFIAASAALPVEEIEEEGGEEPEGAP